MHEKDVRQLGCGENLGSEEKDGLILEGFHSGVLAVVEDAASDGIEDREGREFSKQWCSGCESAGAHARRMEGGGRGDEGEAQNHEAAEGRDWAGAAVDRLRGAETAEAGHSGDMADAPGDLVGRLRHVLQL